MLTAQKHLDLEQLLGTVLDLIRAKCVILLVFFAAAAAAAAAAASLEPPASTRSQSFRQFKKCPPNY